MISVPAIGEPVFFTDQVNRRSRLCTSVVYAFIKRSLRPAPTLIRAQSQ